MDVRVFTVFVTEVALAHYSFKRVQLIRSGISNMNFVSPRADSTVKVPL
jgi:hypothetical protein